VLCGKSFCFVKERSLCDSLIGLGYQGREGGCICGPSLRDIPRMRFGVAPGTESEQRAVRKNEGKKLLGLYGGLLAKGP
ncbi:hypothetical protein KAX17_11130, partial [Candidatus Bipolaricaulota bacterium]|nr:hypothetical protein [Candidatus Bipolaricaulota bacterium]